MAFCNKLFNYANPLKLLFLLQFVGGESGNEPGRCCISIRRIKRRRIVRKNNNKRRIIECGHVLGCFASSSSTVVYSVAPENGRCVVCRPVFVIPRYCTSQSSVFSAVVVEGGECLSQGNRGEARVQVRKGSIHPIGPEKSSPYPPAAVRSIQRS